MTTILYRNISVLMIGTKKTVSSFEISHRKVGMVPEKLLLERNKCGSFGKMPNQRVTSLLNSLYSKWIAFNQCKEANSSSKRPWKLLFPISNVKWSEEWEVPKVWRNGANKTHVGKIQGGDSLTASTTSDANLTTTRGNSRPIMCQGIGRVKSNVGFEGKKSILIRGEVGWRNC